MKVVINDPKTGRSYQKEIEADTLMGKRIGDEVSGDELGLPGYTLKITGGTDSSGFPMVPWLRGTMKKKVLMSQGPGYIGPSIKEKEEKKVLGEIRFPQT